MSRYDGMFSGFGISISGSGALVYSALSALLFCDTNFTVSPPFGFVVGRNCKNFSCIYILWLILLKIFCIIYNVMDL